MAGALAGELLDAPACTRAQERLLHASARPCRARWNRRRLRGVLLLSIDPNAQFWTSSPTFFFIRLGLVTAAIPSRLAHRLCVGAAGLPRALSPSVTGF